MITFIKNNLTSRLGGTRLIAGSRFAWSPNENIVWYEEERLATPEGILSMLHESSHALLHHTGYKNDLQLLRLEVDAWRKARELAREFKVPVEESFVDDCLESYREWLYRRSTCVRCGTNSFQDHQGTYSCHICGSRWQVPTSPLCQVRRKMI